MKTQVRQKASWANPEIVALMIRHDITQAEMARRLQCDRTTVWRWLCTPDLDPARKGLILQVITELVSEKE